MTTGKAPGAQFEISIDGKPRSYRDRKDIALAAAEYLKRKFPNCDVVVKHLPSGEGDRGGVQARHRAALMPLTMRPTGGHSPSGCQDWTIFDDGKPVGRIYEDADARRSQKAVRGVLAPMW